MNRFDTTFTIVPRLKSFTGNRDVEKDDVEKYDESHFNRFNRRTPIAVSQEENNFCRSGTEALVYDRCSLSSQIIQQSLASSAGAV